MNKKNLIILLLILFILLIITGISFSKYSFAFEINAYQILLDKVAPKATVSYSSEELTNRNVLVTINTNEKIKEIEGFSLSEDKMQLTKEIAQNESFNITIKDLMENSLNIPIEVTWIDKEKPKIYGAENNKIYDKGIDLTYKDNVAINYVDVECENSLKISYLNVYYDTENAYGIGFNDKTLKIKIENSPIDIEYYEYYWDEELKYVGKEKEYTYNNLVHQKDNSQIYVKAVDSKGEIYTSNIIYFRPSYFEDIEVQKNEENYTIKIKGIDKIIDNIVVLTWTEFNWQDHYVWKNIIVNEDRTATFTIYRNEHNYELGKYITHMFLREGTRDEYLIGAEIEFGKTYKPKPIESKMFIDDGKYMVNVYDKAGNLENITFFIDKTAPLVDICLEKIENNKLKVTLLNIEDENIISNCKIYLNNEMVLEETANIKTGNQYIIEGVMPGETYNCYVKITDIAGNEGKSITWQEKL